ncbi:MAG: histidinol-phosphate transaminase [Pseudomonadota bacterium]
MIAPASHVAAMSAYALATLEAPAGKTLVSLSQNESLRPPSPRAIQAATEAISRTQQYPDPGWRAVRAAVSTLYDLPMENILCGHGSMDLILCLAQTYAGAQGAILAPAHAYPFFRTAAQLAQARFDVAPEDENGASVDALLDSVKQDTRVLFVANPGNPTGLRLARAELLRLRDRLPETVLLVIDEAYGEFTDHLNEPMFDMTRRGDTIVLRTLSKAYGLAGLRVGWGLFPTAIAKEVSKVLLPNNVSIAGQAAAVAALADQPYMRETREQTITLRDRFSDRLRFAGFNIGESFTNFVLVHFASAEVAQSANEALLSEGVVARAQSGAGLPAALRFTVGPATAMDLAAALLEDWAKGQKK